MMPRDIFRTTREKLQPVFVIEQHNKPPLSLSRTPLQIQNFKLHDSPTSKMESPLLKTKTELNLSSAKPEPQAQQPVSKFEASPPRLNQDTQLLQNSEPKAQPQPPQTLSQHYNQSASLVKTEAQLRSFSWEDQQEQRKSLGLDFVNPAPFLEGKQGEEQINIGECLARIGDDVKFEDSQGQAKQILQRILTQSQKWNLQSGDYERHYRETCGLSDYQVLRRIEDIGEVARQQDQEMLTLQREMQRSGVIRFQ